MNKSLIIGRMVASPELAKTANDKCYARSTVAVNRRFKNEKGEREADFIPMIIWGKSAETFVSYAKKGALLSLEGEIRTRHFTDKQNQTRYVTELLVLSYEMLESKSTLAKRANHVDHEDLMLEGEELPF